MPQILDKSTNWPQVKQPGGRDVDLGHLIVGSLPERYTPRIAGSRLGAGERLGTFGLGGFVDDSSGLYLNAIRHCCWDAFLRVVRNRKVGLRCEFPELTGAPRALTIAP